MHSVDIMLSSAFVLLATAILALGLTIVVISIKKGRVATNLEINMAIVVCQSVISGHCQLICLLAALVFAVLFNGQALPLTAMATVYCGIVSVILNTCLWLTARHVTPYVNNARINTYEFS